MTDKKSSKTSAETSGKTGTEVSEKTTAETPEKTRALEPSEKTQNFALSEKNSHVAQKSKPEIEQEKRPLNHEKAPKQEKNDTGKSKTKALTNEEDVVLEATEIAPVVVTTEMLKDTVVKSAIAEPPLDEVTGDISDEMPDESDDTLTEIQEESDEIPSEVPDESDDISEKTSGKTDGQEKKKASKKYSKAWLWWILGVVLLALCGVVGGLALTQNWFSHSASTEQIEPGEQPNEDETEKPSEETPEEEKPADPEPEQKPEKEPAPDDGTLPPIVGRPQNNDYPDVTPGSRLIALTFDDGPSPATTPRLLDILQGRNVKATFFVLGNLAERNPDILRRETAEGHEVASHTPYHDQLTRLSAAQIRAQALEMDRIFTNILGTVPPFTRPPYGSHNETVRTALAQPLIIWSIDPRDWADRNASIVCSRVTSAAFDGAIILVHDIHATTVDAVPCIVDNLRARGYEFVTVSELAAAKDVPLVNGGVYGSF